MKTKERVESIQSVIQALQSWVKYVTELNECAYSDRILEGALEKLKKISEEPFN